MKTEAAKIGDVITFDDNLIGRKLIASDWDRANFRLQSDVTVGLAVACNVEVTGRTLRQVQGGFALRCKVTFIGDGEANRDFRGWLWASN